jgi:hypothetical protein
VLRAFVHLQEAERAKVVAKLGGWQVAALGELLDAFDVARPSEGNKEHKIGRIMEFLEKPHKASDKDLAALVRGTVWRGFGVLDELCWSLT